MNGNKEEKLKFVDGQWDKHMEINHKWFIHPGALLSIKEKKYHHPPNTTQISSSKCSLESS